MRRRRVRLGLLVALVWLLGLLPPGGRAKAQVVNGDFSSGGTGWTSNTGRTNTTYTTGVFNGTVSYSNGQLTVTGANTSDQNTPCISCVHFAKQTVTTGSTLTFTLLSYASTDTSVYDAPAFFLDGAFYALKSDGTLGGNLAGHSSSSVNATGAIVNRNPASNVQFTVSLSAGTHTIGFGVWTDDSLGGAGIAVFDNVATALSQSIMFTKPADQTFGVGPVSLPASATSGLPVSFASTTASVCTVSGSTATIVGAGTCSMTASQAGNASYTAASNVVQSFNVAKAGQTLAITSTAPANPVAGGAYAVVVTGGGSGNNVTVTIDAASTSGACLISGSTVTFTGAGTCVINANQAGDDNYTAATQVQQLLTISLALAVTTSSLPPGTVGSPYSAPLAASGGTAPYTFTVSGQSTGLSVSGGSITGTPVQAGTFSVGLTAMDAATPAANTSPVRNLTLTIAQGAQVVSFTSMPPTSPAVGSTYTVAATGGASGNAVAFTLDATSTAGACTISGATVSFASPGACIINANQSGNTHYLSATQVQQSITVIKSAQTITFTKPADTAYGAGSVTLSASASSGLAVSFASTTASVCTSSGGTVTLASAGTCSITASQAGNTTFAAATAVMQSFDIAKAAQTIAFTSIPPSPVSIGGAYTVTATGGGSGSPMTFSIDAASASGACTLAGNTVGFTGAGACVIAANQAGNANYSAASQVQQSMTVGKTSQTAAFTSTVPANPQVGGMYAVSATGGASGLPVTFSIDAASASGACTLAGNTVSFTGAGACIVNANQAGNANYSAASQIQQAINIGRVQQSITFTRPADATFGTATVSLSATATSTLTVTFASTTSSVCTVSGATATIVGAGTCSITASQAGNASYLAATAQVQSFSVGKAQQTIAFSKPADVSFGAGPVPLSAAASSGLAVTFTSTTTGVCTVSGTTVTPVGAGTCSITSAQAGNANYAAATDTVRSFNIGKAAQTITFSRPADFLFATGATVSLSASATSGLAVSFASLTASVCTVSGATATIVSIGACSIRASQAGNANYNAAPDVTQSFNALGEPRITATATVSPTSFSRPGVTLVFTFTLTNSGHVAATGLSLRDARLGVISCVSPRIAARGATTCTGSTVSTAADLAARGLSVSPQLTYSYGAPVAASASLAGARSAQAASTAASTITVTIALNVTVTANVDVEAVQAATKSAIQGLLSQRGNLLTTTGPDAARAHARLGAGTLFGGNEGAAVESGLGAGFTSGDRRIERPNGGLGAFGGIRSTLGYEGARGNGGAIGFGDRLGQFGRGASGFGLGGEPGNNFGGPFGIPFGWQPGYRDAADDHTRTAANAFRFSGQAEEGVGRFAFATSLAQMRAAAQTQDQAKRASAGAAGAGAPASGSAALPAPASPDLTGSPLAYAAERRLGAGQSFGPPVAASGNRPGSVDVWVEGSSSYFTNTRIDGRRQGHAAVAHAGIDMVVMPGLLVGVMGSYDWMAETSATLGQNRDGRGWMAGPYMSARLTKNLFFDARAAWGQSTNHIDPLDSYVDTFATTRALASAKLTGDWSHEAWRLRPSAEVIWFTETQKAYINAVGIDISGQTFSIGRTIMGPEVGYRLQFGDKSVLEPFVGLKGVWDFSRTQETTSAGAPVGNDGIRGRIEAGFTYRAPNGITIRGSGAYDGIGSDGFHAVQGQGRLVVPLQ